VILEVLTTLAMWVGAPSTNAVDRGCLSADSVGAPLTDLKEIRIYGKRFTAPDTLMLGTVPAVGREGDSLAFDLDIAPGSMGYLWSIAVDQSGNQSCIGAQYVFALPAVEPPPGVPGLRARYSDNPDFSGDTLVVVDSLVSWQCGSWPMSVAPIPSGTIGPGHFAVRWTGLVTLPTAGTWGFCVESDDGARLWIDGLKLVDRWFAGPAAIKACGTAGLSAGTHTVQLDYFQDGGPCGVKLSWTPPGGAEALVPASALSH
jgi:hypothetical protein